MKIYLSDKDLAARYNVDRTTPWRWVAKGQFPKPVRLSPGTTRWDSDDVDRHDADRKAARNGAAA